MCSCHDVTLFPSLWDGPGPGPLQFRHHVNQQYHPASAQFKVLLSSGASKAQLPRTRLQNETEGRMGLDLPGQWERGWHLRWQFSAVVTSPGCVVRQYGS